MNESPALILTEICKDRFAPGKFAAPKSSVVLKTPFVAVKVCAQNDER